MCRSTASGKILPFDHAQGRMTKREDDDDLPLELHLRSSPICAFSIANPVVSWSNPCELRIPNCHLPYLELKKFFRSLLISSFESIAWYWNPHFSIKV